MRWCAVCGKKTEGPHTLKFVLGGRALVCMYHGTARSAKNLLKAKQSQPRVESPDHGEPCRRP